ncbi:MAG TPA: class I SAM-dependent methyltransferase [Actinomycetes bacterium]|nr:class I SAM-dependent methyltransferase [Actinomycetes bacterium]
MDRTPSAALVNKGLWTQINRQFTDADARTQWSVQELQWGLFAAPETELGAIGDVAGLDVLELGCGTAFFSARLARAGARPVGIDLTPAQLRTARRCQQEFELEFPLLEADAESVPLPDASFDLVVSEYGASVWCDPARWIPEAARLLRPGGRLAFLTNSVLATLCVPDEGGYATEQLRRSPRQTGRIHWPGGGVEFHPSHGDWIHILTSSGFMIDRLHEIYAPVSAVTPDFYDIATPEWASRWPVEDLWVATLGHGAS